MNFKTFIIIIIISIFPNILLGQSHKIDSLQKILKTIKNDSLKIIDFLKIANNFSELYKRDSALKYFNKAEQLSKQMSEESNNEKTETGKLFLASSLLNKGKFLYIFSELDKSEKILNETLEITEYLIRNSENQHLKTEAMKIEGKAYMEITNIYIDKGYYNIALQNSLESQKITDSLIRKAALPEKETAIQYFYLGLINYYLKNYKKSLQYYKQSLQISLKYNNQKGVRSCYINIGVIENDLNRPDSALIYFNKVLDYLKVNDDPLLKAQIYDNISDSKILQKDYKNAELYLAKAMVIVQKYEFTQGEIYIMLGLNDLYNKTHQYSKALHYAEKALLKAKSFTSVSMEKDAYSALSKTYENLYNYKLALNYFKKYKILEDSIFNKEKNKQIQESEAKYHTEKKQEEINSQKLELAKRDIRIKNKINQIYIFTSILLFLLIIILIIVFLLKQKQKINTLIKKQNKRITDSIKYAEKIQKAALPSEKVLSQLFKEHLVFYKPLQIVSGDFYWAVKKDEFIIFASADCTGHGIPGAFVSMLGISFLNELTLISDLTRPDLILEEMRFILKKSFRQTGNHTDQTDGIDISLCSINTKNNELFFAGANNPVYIFRNNEIIEFKATPNPVGVYYKEVKFKMHKTKLLKNDIIYLFTDGYPDQFGGNKHKAKKFTLKRFLNLLSEIHYKSLSEQKKILEREFETWKKNNEQTDDILIFGIKY